MSSYKDIKANCPSRNRYADGGRVSKTKTGAKTVINVISSPPAAGGMPAPGAAAPMGNSPSPAGPPVPPQAAQAMLGAMAGKPQGFKRGGLVQGDIAQDKKTLKSMVKPSALKRANGGRITAGAMSGEGRLQQAARAKRK